jgi:glycosyltransferase involved in cell wall biosynthesis
MTDAGDSAIGLLRRQLQSALRDLRKAQRQVDDLRMENLRKVSELRERVHELEQALAARNPATKPLRQTPAAAESAPVAPHRPGQSVGPAFASGAVAPTTEPEIARRHQSGNDPDVSIVIPVYNKEEYLEECVRSVLENGFENLEVVCVDDASTDSSAEILKSLSHRFSRLSFIPLSANSGASVARNTGMQQARGKYVGFLDADDRLTPGAVGELVATAEANDSDLVRGKITGFTDADEPHALAGEPFLHERSANLVHWPEEESLWFYWYFSANLYRKSFLDQHLLRFPTGIRNEDPVFLCRCFLAAQRITLIDQVVYHYRIGTEQKRKTPSASFLRGWAFGYYAISDLLRDRGLPYHYFITHLPSVQAHCQSMAQQPDRADALRLLRPVSNMFSRYNLGFARDPSTQPWERKRAFPPPLLEFYENAATLPLEALCDWLRDS